MEFEVSYGYTTFDDIISAGLITVEADSIESAQDGALSVVLGKLSEDLDEEAVGNNIKKISVSVTPKI